MDGVDGVAGLVAAGAVAGALVICAAAWVCCCPAAYFVHAKGTTRFGGAQHAKGGFDYGARCGQCGRDVHAQDPMQHVAAHVVAYPCCNSCVGCLTLRTSCKGCNGAEASFVGNWWRRDRSVTARGSTAVPGLGPGSPVCWPCCLQLDYAGWEPGLAARSAWPVCWPGKWAAADENV